MLTTDRPTPLRLAGFLATVLGALLMGVGAVTGWGKVDLVDTKGVDIPAGKLTLLISVLILIGVPTMRLARSRRVRAAIAWSTLAGSLAVGALAAWALADPPERVGRVAIEAEAHRLAEDTGLPEDQLAEELRRVTRVDLEPGIYMTIVGAGLGVAGGALSLAWIGRRDPSAVEAESTVEPA
jgi:hypothetical protein